MSFGRIGTPMRIVHTRRRYKSKYRSGRSLWAELEKSDAKTVRFNKDGTVKHD